MRLLRVSNTRIEEQLLQQQAWMTDEELICNLVKRFSLNVFRLVGNFPSAEQKRCEVAGFSCCHSSEELVTPLVWRSDLQCNKALCSRVKKALRQQLPSSSFPPRSTQAQTCPIVSARSWLSTCWFIRHCSNSIWPTANYSIITEGQDLTIYMCS